MGWFAQRKLTLLEAFTLRRVLALPIVIAVVTAVVHASIALSRVFMEPEDQPLLGVPSWIYGALAGLLLLLYFLLEYANRLRQQLEPSLHASFNPAAEGIVRTPTEIYGPQGKIRDDEAVFIRVTLSTSSRTVVRGCVAFLTKLEKSIVQPQSFFDVPINGALGLTSTPFEVYPRIPTTVDFLKCGQHDNKLEPTTPWPFRLRGALDEAATYRFTIEVSADGSNNTVRVEVDWFGRWDTIVARQS